LRIHQLGQARASINLILTARLSPTCGRKYALRKMLDMAST
jgi:hypothetical protein